MPTIGEILDPGVVKRLNDNTRMNLQIALDLEAVAKPKRRAESTPDHVAAKAAASEERAALSTRTPPTIKSKEQDVDVNNIPDAELGAKVRTLVKTSKAKKVKKASKEVLAKRAKAEAKDLKARKKEQGKRKHRFYKGYKVSDTLTIPDLDLREVTSLDETPSAKQRAPYNKARFRLLGEPPLPAKGNQPDDVDPEDSATYRTLIAEHERLRGVVQDKAKQKKVKGSKKVLQAKLTLNDKAKIKALRKLAGISEERARAVLGL